MLSLPQVPFLAVGLLEALAAASGMAAASKVNVLLYILKYRFHGVKFEELECSGFNLMIISFFLWISNAFWGIDSNIVSGKMIY